MRYVLRSVLAALLVSFTVATSFATTIGPGDQATGGSHDSNGNAAFLDVFLSNSASLSAGSYSTTFFNYEFTSVEGSTSAGSITPLLLVDDGLGGYKPIAIGTAVTYAADTGSFVSTSFGGSNTFTLGTTTTVYAGFYWPQPGVASVDPIGFTNGAGSDFFRYGGANTPVIGTSISGGGALTQGRMYEYSVTIEVTPAPEPGSLMLFGCGALGLVAVVRRRRRA